MGAIMDVTMTLGLWRRKRERERGREKLTDRCHVTPEGTVDDRLHVSRDLRQQNLLQHKHI